MRAAVDGAVLTAGFVAMVTGYHWLLFAVILVDCAIISTELRRNR